MSEALSPAEELRRSFDDALNYWPNTGQKKLGKRLPLRAFLSRFPVLRQLPGVWSEERSRQWLLERDIESYHAAQESVRKAIRSAYQVEGRLIV